MGIFGVNFLFSPEVPGLGRKFWGTEVPGVMEFLPGRTLNSRSENGDGKTRFPEAKLRQFRGWKVGKRRGMLDPLITQRIHGSKSTKHHQNPQITKNWGLFLVGIFGFRTKSTKSS